MFDGTYSLYSLWLIGLLIIAVVCAGILIHKFVHLRSGWGEKARDRWFVQMMWAFTAGALQVESLIRSSPVRYRTVFVTAALIVLLRLLTKKYDEDVTRGI